MESAIQNFIVYLHNVKKTSYNTEISYQRDLNKLLDYLEDNGITKVNQITGASLSSYIMHLEKKQFASSSISRTVASVRAFSRYLFKNGMIKEDPSEELKPPKVEKKAPGILSVEEVDILLKEPDAKSPKGIRDKAMLELLYATGMRVSELLRLSVDDVNMKMCYIVCHDTNKERVIPFGNVCKKALNSYLTKARVVFVGEREVDSLFTNCSGKPMSRQGFWKVLKGYAASAGIQGDITPHTLRHSFAAHLLQNGADVKSVQEMLGHSDISTTQMYLNLNVNKMRDVYMHAHPRR